MAITAAARATLETAETEAATGARKDRTAMGSSSEVVLVKDSSLLCLLE